VHTQRDVGPRMHSLDCLHSKPFFVSSDRVFTQVLPKNQDGYGNQCVRELSCPRFSAESPANCAKFALCAHFLSRAHCEFEWVPQLVYRVHEIHVPMHKLERKCTWMQSNECAEMRVRALDCIVIVHSNYFFLFPSTAPDFRLLQIQFKCPLKKNVRTKTNRFLLVSNFPGPVCSGQGFLFWNWIRNGNYMACYHVPKHVESITKTMPKHFQSISKASKACPKPCSFGSWFRFPF
jgi:hypothetical protein